ATFDERMQYFGHFETLLHARFPEHELVVRNLGWSADELTVQARPKDNADEIGLRPRSANFKDHGHTLFDHKPDVVIACFGFNESFAGPAVLKKFEADVESFIRKITSTNYNGKDPPRLAMVSLI